MDRKFNDRRPGEGSASASRGGQQSRSISIETASLARPLRPLRRSQNRIACHRGISACRTPARRGCHADPQSRKASLITARPVRRHIGYQAVVRYRCIRSIDDVHSFPLSLAVPRRDGMSCDTSATTRNELQLQWDSIGYWPVAAAALGLAVLAGAPPDVAPWSRHARMPLDR